jgi:3-dehydroquinate synthase
VDENVFELFKDSLLDYLDRRDLQARLLVMPSGEARKNVAASLHIAEMIDEFTIDRRGEPIIVMGGGTLMDAVGLTASIYRRGTPYVKIPTTLVGLVDAGIGIKTGINHNGHKNRLGTYHPPTQVLLDPGFLRTLPSSQISCGLAEIAKIGLICDASLWTLLSQNAEALLATTLGTTDPDLTMLGEQVIARAVHGMLNELHTNLWEQNLQRLVDFGHTFSPVLEMEIGPDLPHGEAVALDMAISSVISACRGMLPQAELTSVLAALSVMKLPLWHPACTLPLLKRGLEEATRHRGGCQHFPVPLRPGLAAVLEDVTAAELARAIDVLQDFPGSAHEAD